MMLGGIPTPLKNMRSSVGMIKSNIWENKIDDPNHQPVFYRLMCVYIYIQNMGLFFHSYIVPRPSKTLRLYPEKLLREFHNFGVVAKSQHIFVRFFFGNPHKDRMR